MEILCSGYLLDLITLTKLHERFNCKVPHNEAFPSLFPTVLGLNI